MLRFFGGKKHPTSISCIVVSSSKVVGEMSKHTQKKIQQNQTGKPTPQMITCRQQDVREDTWAHGADLA